MSKLSVSCRAFHPLHRNTLRGFCEIHIDEIKLSIRDVAVHQKGESRWAQLPAKPQVRDGTLIQDAAGKIQYTALLDFDSRAVRDAFSAAVIRALLDFAPTAFEDGDV
jgi:hypothetical protein